MFWLLPAVVLLLLLLVAFGTWVVRTEPGSRWALQTGIYWAGGEVRGVNGNFWDGLTVGALHINTPAVRTDIADLQVRFDWPALRDRRLHAVNISAGALTLDVLNANQPSSGQPFSMPALPVTVALDRFHIGELNLSVDDKPVLLKVRNLDASLAVNTDNAELVFRRLAVGHEDIEADVEGRLQLTRLADPWPFQIDIQTRARSDTANSLLCARRFLPTLPVASKPDTSAKAETPEEAQAREPSTELDAVSTFCAVDLSVQAQGSTQQADLTVSGQGQDMHLDLTAKLAPKAAFPVRQANVSLGLSDGSSLKGNLQWQAGAGANPQQDNQVTGRLDLDRLNVGLLLGDAMPQAVLTSSLNFQAALSGLDTFKSAALKLDIAEASRWNGQAVSGRLNFGVLNTAASGGTIDPRALQVRDLDVDLRLGANHLVADGELGLTRNQINLSLDAPRLADFWAGLQGRASLKALFQGPLSNHRLSLKAGFDAGAPGGSVVGKAPVQAEMVVAGGWQDARPAQLADGKADAGAQSEGAEKAASQPAAWSGRIESLKVDHAGMALDLQRPVALRFEPSAAAPAYWLSLGDTSIKLTLPSKDSFVLDHAQSAWAPGRWKTAGKIDRLTLSKKVIDELTQRLGQADETEAASPRGRVILDVADENDQVEINYGLNWAFSFDGALAGKGQLRRLGGDLIVPGDPPFPLGLRELLVDFAAKPVGGGSSRLSAQANIETTRMGQAQVEATSLLHYTSEKGFALDTAQGTTVRVRADVQNLAWLSLFVGDATELGGSLQADVQARSKPDGTWDTRGTISGRDIRFVRIDDGVRLIQGTLEAHLAGDRVILDSLKFPAIRRATPKEWRTEEWTRANPDAQGGSLTLTGYWDLSEQNGKVEANLYRYPILQRADRFAMVTGKIQVDAPLPALAISGKLDVDAGWVDLDMLSSVPTVDSDVVVLRPGQQQPKASPLDISLDLSIGLGPRFYITGYGVDSGLVGDLRLIMQPQGRLSAYGALRTRGGGIEAYGQKLRLRQGTITFQGDIASPVLNIEALRTGQAVEAGVRVSGTARRPKIDLISYPDVADVQKLSWLLLGRGPDESGGDAALLFSVGSSFLGDGEPFYKKFGLDEVSMRSGELGSVGSILPAESVVRGLDSGTSDIERQFVVAAKHLASGFTLSVEQALSQTGTVGRVSYRLARGLSAQLSVGTINGLALIWRTFSAE